MTDFLTINRFPGDGVTTDWNINFAGGYINKLYVKAYIQDNTTGAILSNITFDEADFIGPNTLRVTPATPVGQTTVIYRDTPKDNPLVDFTDGSMFTEANLDLLARQAIQVSAESADQVGTAAADAQAAAQGAQAAVDIANAAVADTAASAAAAASSAASAAGSASAASSSASAAATSQAAAASSASAASASQTSAASSATSAGNSATSASASASAASTSATNAATSASTATTKASEASTSATNAASSASAASTSATNAANSASSASGSASAAASSASSAATSASDAAGILDNFDDRYLGSKTSNPTLDNDGNTLLVGALYWNSVANEMRVWNGTTWQYLVATVAAAVGFTPTGDLAATNVQTALGELDTEKAPKAAPTLTGRTKADALDMKAHALGSGSGTRALDQAVANFFSATVAGATTFTFNNPAASGYAGAFALELTNGGSATVTWPASVDWPGGIAPTLTAAGIDLLVFVTDDAGTTWRGNLAMKDSK